ncbi:MAG: hypothetical protein ABL907_19720, partial [Hyphomicrobium sp.]
MTQHQAAQRPPFRVPEWDRKAVAAPYLIHLRQQAAGGSFKVDDVDNLLHGLASELRAVYTEQDVDRALDGLERVFANIDQMAEAARAAAQMSERDLVRGHTPEIGGRWKAVARPSVFAQVSQATHGLLARAQAATVSVANDVVVGIRAHREQAAQNEVLRREAVQREAVERERQRDEQAAEERAAQAQVDAQRVTLADVPTSAPARSRRLNGAAMHRSSFPTWLMLVVLSWVSLLWGALISLPFGVGLGMLATFFGGMIAVPIWATIFGFGGMGSARSATLRDMG